ncbi:class I SAM-dependent methyltransferase [Noviherbaspirillum massiliense]|uniref:class I SAM-dependent methyltransferase n=1 Tax=Noviherbaspirillum massiliense TaxID=1465823 RepID=UPI0002ED4768|nr:class I SAM-dependent methyltransferase [Noviherbaspirillum massiliense]
MKENHSSKTAEDVARLRAAHQLMDHPRVFDDPVALRIAGAEAFAATVADRQQGRGRTAIRALRAAVVARSRYAEEQLARAVETGVRQYVILGAGLDTFAYRCEYAGLHVFEVDYPATQVWKRKRLAEAGIEPPPCLHFVPIDFETQSLSGALQDAGLDANQPAFFSWLGVTPYLSRGAIMATLGFIAASMQQGSAVIFDYMVAPHLLDPVRRTAFEAMASRVAELGEPWRASFEPAALASELKEIGFPAIRDMGPEELNALYFRDRTDGLRVSGMSRIMLAMV